VGVDAAGNILSMWESEDPADKEFPYDEPMGLPLDDDGNEIPGTKLLQVRHPTAAQIEGILGEADKLDMPAWLAKSKYRDQKLTPKKLLRKMVEAYVVDRGLEDPGDIRAAFTDVSDEQRRFWYLMLFLRQFSRVQYGHRNPSLIRLYRDRFRVNAAGELVLQ